MCLWQLMLILFVNIVSLDGKLNILFTDTNTNDSDKEPSAISHPSILLWKPVSSISDHDCKKLICIYSHVVHICILSIEKYLHAITK